MPTDIDVAVDSNSVEACHRFRKPKEHINQEKQQSDLQIKNTEKRF